MPSENLPAAACRTGQADHAVVTFSVGRNAAHVEWFYGFRLAVRTDLGSRVVRWTACSTSGTRITARSSWTGERAPAHR